MVLGGRMAVCVRVEKKNRPGITPGAALVSYFRVTRYSAAAMK